MDPVLAHEPRWVQIELRLPDSILPKGISEVTVRARDDKAQTTNPVTRVRVTLE